MRKLLLTASCLTALVAFASGPVLANDELIKMSENPKNWVMPAGDYANTRYSKLNQITADNVGKLQVAWTFSTGVLRGHEGAPLVIDGTMYVHTPFPNTVYALDLNDNGSIKWAYQPKQDPNVMYGRPPLGKVQFGEYGAGRGAVMYTASDVRYLGPRAKMCTANRVPIIPARCDAR